MEALTAPSAIVTIPRDSFSLPFYPTGKFETWRIRNVPAPNLFYVPPVDMQHAASLLANQIISIEQE